ncbi:Protein CBG04392 [Caenorhabditis briggsae]|uniref:Uncharacterized protein n=2 Tax=Caenorhabditis briggsae TaxID=6238 RepID=A0AAE9ACN9_CAEBR|nr:Protein CBG04392 [Caenorhabditis briggsae]ULT96950.1 hypothetical protein L3Y34_005044 [Caenorhabditis briggsae]CAP25105.1 Protein CBG04392 [Caenorhabditis briggsae]
MSHNYESATTSSHTSSTTKKIANAIAELVSRRSSPSIRRKTEADVLNNSARGRKVSAPGNLQHALVPCIDVVVATGALASSSVENISASTSRDSGPTANFVVLIELAFLRMD